MPNNVDLESLEPAVLPAKQDDLPDAELAAKALECARAIIWAPGTKTSQHFVQRLKKLNDRMQPVLATVERARALAGVAATDEQRWLSENIDLLRSELAYLHEARIELTRTEHVRRPDREVAPRVLVIAEDLLGALNYCFADTAFSEYLRAFQTVVVLRQSELWQMVPAVKLVLLERIADLATRMLADHSTPGGIGSCIRSLREVGQAPWNELLEPLIVFGRVLRRDPTHAYGRMDAQTREMYRQAVGKIAEYSDYSEVEIAEMAVSLARQSGKPERDPRAALRKSHVGYYLLAEGREQLYRRANVRLPVRDRFQEFLRRHPDEFYLLGIEVLTLGMVLAALWWVSFSSLGAALLAAIALLIPCSQSAVQIMYHLTTTLLDPQPLPKLNLANGIPEDCTTMVVVPTLLLNERQVRQLVKELEVRYVANMSANLHFALLTDLADSAEQPCEDDPLVELCGELIRELNRKYAGNGAGTFAMFHRHRVYNRREGVWMGWERKRGKLLDFNQLILGYYDSFPYKAGNLSVLSSVQYVLTLDSDTELPRGAAQRLIGTMAHPLCQAIIDRERNIVTQGYGMLQPRVGVSVQSAAQSRLASIYSGRTGFDIYTRAISDVYQDLYGEGSFVGKGLYEVRTVHRVVDKRFPRNAILSHDLIEGAYTRAGLVSDVEVIDHYPSHYSAYARRKHRWVRGDWQIMEWLFSHVPDESGRRVPNPISFISRWKILDNLRRSVVEPATLALFLLAWTLLPGQPLYWTLVSLGILFAPAVFELVAGLLHAVVGGGFSAAKDALASFATGAAGVLLSLAFLVHDALVSSDAIWRSLYRTVVSRRKLLQWETAAEAELGAKKRTPLDRYLLGTPAIALAVGVLLFFVRRPAVRVALPILVLWACSKLISLWLDRPPRIARKPPNGNHERFLRRAALRTWRYFAELSTEEHNWLIPDNLQEDPAQLAARVSPTNLGFLLNARQVACELGYLTVPEFAGLTRRTLETMDRLQSYRGHLLNWYDTRTLAPMAPLFVSSVDSGNLAAALATLNQGCRALLEKPLLSPALLDGYDDHLRALAGLKALSSRMVKRSIRARKNLRFPQRLFAVISEALITGKSCPGGTEAQWFAAQLGVRRERLQNIISDYMPWLLPEFESVRHSFGIDPASAVQVPLAQLPGFIADLQTRLAALQFTGSEEGGQTCGRLSTLLAEAHARSIRLAQELEGAAGDADRWFTRMDFSFLLERRRKLLSIGCDLDTGRLHPACYDLLASESRVATFVGIAKGEIPQEVWLKLGRTHVPNHGVPTLISWAGTMFEYLMPAIWMRSYSGTLLQRSMEGAVVAQQAYTEKKGIRWGISESGYCELNEAGSYRYGTFGVPALALQSAESNRLVIAPYASAMALAVDPAAALENLRRMEKSGWFGKYGFYEAADFGPAEGSRRREWRLVKSWMAHHQGMSLLAMANFLCGDAVRQWFHDDVRVQATELLLQERTVLHRVRPAWHIRPPIVPVRTPTISGGELALES
jgi:cyclic beta-1,2-glucan synthetase